MNNTELSTSFFHISTFDSDYLPLHSGGAALYYCKFTNFQFKNMFGGERFIYFVDRNDDIVYFKAFDPSDDMKDAVGVELSKLVNHQFVFARSVNLKASYIKIKKHLDFVPHEFYRNIDTIYVVDNSRTRVLRINPETSEDVVFQLNCKIKQVMTGPLANQFLIINEKGELMEMSKKEVEPVKVDVPDSVTLRCGGCWSHGFMVVDLDNKIYVKEDGNHIRSGLGFSDYVSDLNHLPTFLENKHTITDIKGGYYHAILKTKENKVFCCGYDNMNQATFGLKADTSEYNNLTECPLDFGEIVSFGGFSRGEYFLNKKNEVFCVAEMFADFVEKPFPNFPFVQKFNLDELGTLAGIHQLKPNDVLNTGWQCCFFHNSYKTIEHTRTREKLFETLKNSKLVDVAIFLQNDGYY